MTRRGPHPPAVPLDRHWRTQQLRQSLGGLRHGSVSREAPGEAPIFDIGRDSDAPALDAGQILNHDRQCLVMVGEAG